MHEDAAPPEETAERLRQEAEMIVRVLRRHGFQAYFAGGCVRDMLLEKTPKDFDIATSARPSQVQDLFPNAQSVGAHFGVILVRRPPGHFEIATFRRDGDYTDGRHPDTVTFSGPEEDARRRDFTVNGLFFDPVEDHVLDFVGGQADLSHRLLRAIGDPDERFSEDYLRVLRAVRLATVLGFEIEEKTWVSVKKGAPNVLQIAPERVRDEIVRTLTAPDRLRGFDLLVESGIMGSVWPEIIQLQGCEQPPKWHPEGDVFVHTRMMLGMLPPDASLTLVLSVLFHDIGKPATFTYDEADDRIRFNGHDQVGAEMTSGILRRLKFSNDVIDTTVAAVASHMAFKDVQQMRTAKLKRFMARPHFGDELELHRADCLSSNGLLDNYDFLLEKREAFANEPLIPAPLVNGRDLIELGHRPGPRFREILTEVQTLQLEGSLTSRQDALAYLNEHHSVTPPPADT